MLEGYVSIPVEHFGGLIASWPSELLDVSLATEAHNVRFTTSGVMSREGLTPVLRLLAPAAIAGLEDYLQPGDLSTPLVFDAAGKLWSESPPGSGVLQPVSTLRLAPPAASRMQGAAAYGRCYLAFGDGRFGQGTPAFYDGGGYAGLNLFPVTIPAPAASAVAADAGSAGNVAAGQRYGIVLFCTAQGTLSPPAGPFAWTAAGNQQVTVSNLPAGPAEVAQRIVAFTVAGGSSAGPYFYIPLAQTVNGVNETATVVASDAGASATFNFDDDFLAASIDVTDQFRAVALPAEAGVFYSALTDRLLWWGETAQPSLLRCSAPGQPGTYYGDTGFALVADNDGQRITACFEYRDRLIVAKEDCLYLVTPNDGDPSAWNVQPIAQGIGVCGALAVDLGDGVAFLVHRTGGYLFDGGAPQLVTDELLGVSPDQPGPWQRINWAFAHRIWVLIDTEEKCVRIGVPLDEAEVCSHILKCSYVDGWNRSIRFSPFTARYHYSPGRRWSVDAIAAAFARRIRRPNGPGAEWDRRRSVEQTLLGSSAADGAISTPDASATADNGVPFESRYTTGSASAAELLQQQRQGVEAVGLVQVRARGTSRLEVAMQVDGGEPRRFLTCALALRACGDFQGLALAQGENVALRFSGPGGWRLLGAYLFARPIWRLR